jgi:2-polyprenyl-3-methyl-5-hydroxy-6-metoxy-1,4-benzoquinol methylase
MNSNDTFTLTNSPDIAGRFESCPCCSSQELHTIWKNSTPEVIHDWKSFMFGGRKFFDQVMGCGACGFQYLEPVVNGNVFYRTAHEGEYQLLRDERRRYFSKVKAYVQNRGYTLPEKSKILDLGAGEGDWLSLWPETHQRYATEMLPKYMERMTDQGISMLPDLNSTTEKFDMITAFDFLEHVENPNQLLQTISSKLNQNGMTVISVPNMGKFLAQIFSTKYYLYCPMHYSYFTHNSLRKILSKYFNSVEIFASPAMYCTLNSVAKWIFPKLQSPLLNHIQFPFGYSASIIAVAKNTP